MTQLNRRNFKLIQTGARTYTVAYWADKEPVECMWGTYQNGIAVIYWDFKSKKAANDFMVYIAYATRGMKTVDEMLIAIEKEEI